MMRRRHPGEILALSLAWLVLSFVLWPMPWAPVVLICTSLTAIGQLRIRAGLWLAAMSAPAAFSLLAVPALAWNAGFHWSDASVWASPLRSVAASSALLLLGLSTPMQDLLHLGRRCRVPAAWIDLALLLHRFASVAVEASGSMARAMSMRAPRASYLKRVRAAAWLSATLFERILARARRSEYGLAARGVSGFVVPSPPQSRMLWRRAALSLCGPAAVAAAAVWTNWR